MIPTGRSVTVQGTVSKAVERMSCRLCTANLLFPSNKGHGPVMQRFHLAAGPMPLGPCTRKTAQVSPRPLVMGAGGLSCAATRARMHPMGP